MIIKHFTDNDLYKFSVMHAIQKLYPWAYVRYDFINRGKDDFPKGFAERLKEEINKMISLKLTNDEKNFILKRCYFLDPFFVDFLEGYRYNPDEVHISQEGGKLNLYVEGYWYRTVLWEVPLMAMISELYFEMIGTKPKDIEIKAKEKAIGLKNLKADYSEFGTRRRYSFDVQDKVVGVLKENSDKYFKGTSNVYLAMKYNTTPIGTMPHEWFMYHGALFGYRSANIKALEAWVDVFQGSLGITLTDTYTSQSFFKSFNLKLAKLFDGVRCDSGDPLEFTEKTIDFYKKNRIDPSSKTIVFSDSLNLNEVKKIKEHVKDRIHDTYGIGTYLSNDVGVKPLNMVIKLTHVKEKPSDDYLNAVKLSDVLGKNTGDENEINFSKLSLGLNENI
ncbi:MULTISPECIES: nicotinate phosphoribosyltransferase [unclassified Apibacter]|uniref:nicotinate phosphoribosyltransferase n=1 Tax=unclassified Apibacter TaxID=2630820 RepID=UPI001368587C|nr:MULTISPECIES: nicotinate phosphoribosyltransferase [unclassified Apibacter]MXO31580.1 nicotinate phosphoribosyltransferase [Apibacter sp. B2912]QII71937.1 nicotinate phosphoribosyltransferase [Apibacter sp. B2966]